MMIRLAKKEDVEKIIPLWEKTRDIHAELNDYWKIIPNASEKYKEYVSKEIKNENSRVFVVEKEKIIGFLHCKIERDFPIYDRFVCKLDSMFVEDEYRGKGISQELFFEMERFAKEKNAEYIVEYNGIENKRATNFYENVGLEPLVEMRIKKVGK